MNNKQKYTLTELCANFIFANFVNSVKNIERQPMGSYIKINCPYTY